jgi:hypothetical protein
MATGPGKYDDLCSLVRKGAGMDEGSSGGAVVIIIGGNKGNGFSVHADAATTILLPDMLENMARIIRRDWKGMLS